MDLASGLATGAEYPLDVTTVVSLVLYTLAQASERGVSASLGATAP
jgi:hypothetical protein